MGKKVSGRKRHIVVDTLGHLVAVKILAANIQDKVGAKELLQGLDKERPRVRHIFGDAAYGGRFPEWVAATLGWTMEVVRKPMARRRLGGKEFTNPEWVPEGFHVLRWRWRVERTFAWLGRYRRLSKDYEYLCKTGENFIRMASSLLLLSRMANGYY